MPWRGEDAIPLLTRKKKEEGSLHRPIKRDFSPGALASGEEEGKRKETSCTLVSNCRKKKKTPLPLRKEGPGNFCSIPPLPGGKKK